MRMLCQVFMMMAKISSIFSLFEYRLPKKKETLRVTIEYCAKSMQRGRASNSRMPPQNLLV